MIYEYNKSYHIPDTSTTTHFAPLPRTEDESTKRVVNKSVLEADQKREQVRREQGAGRKGKWSRDKWARRESERGRMATFS